MDPTNVFSKDFLKSIIMSNFDFGIFCSKDVFRSKGGGSMSVLALSCKQ